MLRVAVVVLQILHPLLAWDLMPVSKTRAAAPLIVLRLGEAGSCIKWPVREADEPGPLKYRTPSASLTPPNLLLEHFFDLSDLFLNLAGVLFGVAFGL